MSKDRMSKNLKKFEKQDRLLLEVSKFIKLNRLRAVIFSFKQENARNIYFPLNDNFKKILIMMEDYSKSNNSEFIFVYVPNYKKYTKKNYKNKNYGEILKIIDELDIKFIDLHKNLMTKFKDPTELYISTGQLHALPRFHIQPINVVVYHGSIGRTSFEASFPLRCFQRLSLPYLATRHCSWRYNRSTSGMSIPVLSY